MKKITFNSLIILMLGLIMITVQVQAEEGLTGLTLEQALEQALTVDQDYLQARKELKQLQEELNLYKKMFAHNYSLSLRSDYNLLEKEDAAGYNPTLSSSESSSLNLTGQFSSDSSLTISQQALVRDKTTDQVELLGTGVISYTHQLISGFDPKNDYQNSLLLKESSLLDQQQRVRTVEESIRVQTMEKYYNLLRLQKEIELKEELLEQSRTAYAAARARVQTGDAPLLDQREAALQVEENELSLASSRSDYSLALQELETKLKLSLNREVKLTGAEEMQQFNYQQQEVLQSALASSIRLKQLAGQKAQQKYLISAWPQKNLPTIALAGQVAYDQDHEFPTDYRIGLNLDYQFNTFNQQNSKLEEKYLQSDLESLLVREKEIKHAVEQQVLQAVTNLQQLNSRISFNQQAVGVAEEKLAIAELKYKSGLTTISDLIAKQIGLMEKKTAGLELVISYNQQIHHLYLLMGR